MQQDEQGIISNLNSNGPTAEESRYLTGRPAITLYLSCDYFCFSPYQILVRKNIEFFEAFPQDVITPVQGRPRPISMGQVGIRCCFCAHLHPSQRAPGATCYPSKRSGIYQAAQNMANVHFLEQCAFVPETLKQELQILRTQKSAVRGSKAMWEDHATALGVYDDVEGLRFAPRVNSLGFPPSRDRSSSFASY